MEQQARTRRLLPSVMMRCGTSKGLFLHRRDLPQDQSLWSNVLLSAMGSRDGDSRQLDGVGGATSTTSKVAIVSKSTRPGIDVDYTFAQVGVGSSKVDFSGNCGNICSGVGPFALDEGLVEPGNGQTEMDVRIFNTNTSREIVETIKIGPDGKFCEFGDYRIGGVKGTASEIEVAFINPAGSMTGKLLPTGLPQETLNASSTPGMEPFTVNVSMVDAANPFVFVDASTMPKTWQSLDRNDPMALEIVEIIRRIAAVRMGLARDEASASQVRGTPKIAILSQAESRTHNDTTPDIHVTSYSMGKMHPSFQLTGAVCLSAAISIPGTVVSDIAERQDYPTPPGTPDEGLEGVISVKSGGFEKQVVIEHASGEITARVKTREDSMEGLAVESVTVSRTARRLFEGNVLINV
ncbi:methylitaconate delta2-delta3-isomerase [Leptodontidium sp. 2 PMI_412]|nr:methylitaconate delta2-delta3-isomerase [Leptodontidium sp. 2 PMI_412]